MGEPPPREAVKQQDGSYILRNEDGTTSRWTRRPDGTWRKPERKKAGFVGELEQQKYVSPGSKIERDQQDRLAAQNAHKGQVPGAPPAQGSQDLTKAARKNERKKQQRREKADAKDADRLNGHEEEDVGEDQVQKHPEVVPEAVVEEKVVSLEKRIKAVEKKLRQVAELEERKAGGTDLNPDQQNKLDNKQALLEELQRLRDGDLSIPTQAPEPTETPVAAVQAPTPEAQAPAPLPNRKALQKKLRQIEDLEQKQANGEALDADQLRKIASRPELEAQLAQCDA